MGWLEGLTEEQAMKKSARNEHASETSRRSARGSQADGKWEFAASQSLYTLGSTEQAKRVAYRTATGEVRFLPL